MENTESVCWLDETLFGYICNCCEKEVKLTKEEIKILENEPTSKVSLHCPYCDSGVLGIY